MGVDIEQELAVIYSQAGGETVKSAIVSALNKIAPTRGADVTLEFDHGLMLEDQETICDIYTNGDDKPPFDAAQDNADNNGIANSRTVTLTVTKDSLLVAAVMHRVSVDIITLSGDNWTHVATSDPPCKVGANPDENGVQYISVWAKQVTPGDYTVTATYQQNKSRQLNLKLIALHGMTTITETDYEVIQSFPYFPPAKMSPCNRLYITTNMYAFNTDLLTKNMIVQDRGLYPYEICPQGRFQVLFDNDTDPLNEPIFGYDHYESNQPADYNNTVGYKSAAAMILEVS